MPFRDELEKKYPGRVKQPADASAMEAGFYYVYILTVDERPIVIGHGKRNRARVIFDSEASITPNHIKALTVRLYLLFPHDGVQFGRYLIQCESKEEAQEIEAKLHRESNFHRLKHPEAIQEALFQDFDVDSAAGMVIRMALCSSFDGIADLKRWRDKGILGDTVWGLISERLKLPFDL